MLEVKSAALSVGLRLRLRLPLLLRILFLISILIIDRISALAWTTTTGSGVALSSNGRRTAFAVAVRETRPGAQSFRHPSLWRLGAAPSSDVPPIRRRNNRRGSGGGGASTTVTTRLSYVRNATTTTCEAPTDRSTATASGEHEVDSALSSSSSSSSSFHDFLVNDLQRQYQQLLLSEVEEQSEWDTGTHPEQFQSLSSSASSLTLTSADAPVAAVSTRKEVQPLNPAVAPSSSTATATTTPSSDDSPAAVRARWLLLLAAALYGTNFSCVKLLGEAHLPVGASSTVRFGMAALATAPWLLPENFLWGGGGGKGNSQNAPSLTSSWPAILAGLEVGAWNSIGYVAQAVGLETTPASKSAFLCSLAVVVVPLLDYAFKGKAPKGREGVGIVLALLGVAALELGGLGDGTSLALAPGDLASLVQPLAFGMGFWRMEAAMRKHPNQALRTTAAQLLAVFAGSALYCFGIEGPSAASGEPTLTLEVMQTWLTQPAILLGLVWTGIVTTALTVYLETMALETLSAAETTLIFSTEPLWGTAFAAAVVGERLGYDSAVGALLIVTGCLVSNLGVKGLQDRWNQLVVGATAALATATAKGSHNSNNSRSRSATIVPGSGAAVPFTAVAAAWNTLAIGLKVWAIELENVLQDLGVFSESN